MWRWPYKKREKELSDTFNKVFIGALLLIIFSLTTFIVFNRFSIKISFGSGNLLGLSDSFWGSLSGALIAGLTAIWISQKEHHRQIKEKREEINKILLNLRENAEELYAEMKIINEINKKIKEVPDPYRNVTEYIDDNRHAHYENLPPDFLIEEYDNILAPFKKKLMQSHNHILDLLEELKMIQIKDLDLESYKKVLTFKIKSRKIIEPAFNYSLQKNMSTINSKELKQIEEIIVDFYKSVI